MHAHQIVLRPLYIPSHWVSMDCRASKLWISPFNACPPQIDNWSLESSLGQSQVIFVHLFAECIAGSQSRPSEVVVSLSLWSSSDVFVLFRLPLVVAPMRGHSMVAIHAPPAWSLLCWSLIGIDRAVCQFDCPGNCLDPYGLHVL